MSRDDDNDGDRGINPTSVRSRKARADEISGEGGASQSIQPDLGEGTSGTKAPLSELPLPSPGSAREDDLEGGGRVSELYPKEFEQTWSLKNMDICVNALLRKLKTLPQLPRGAIFRQPSIWRVPPQLRNLDPEAYEPKLVSIGPLHHGRSELSPMEKVKLENLCYFQGGYPEDQLQRYFEKVFDCLKDVRDDYSEDINLSDNEFAEMLVVDGFFVIAYLLQNSCPAIASATLIPHVRWGFDHLSRDLLLLENQIPFFLVNALFEEAEEVISRIWPLYIEDLDLVPLGLRFLNIKLPREGYPEKNQVLHLLHLQHLAQDPLRLRWITHLPSNQSLQSFLLNSSYRLISVPLLGLLYLLLFCDCYGLIGAPKKLLDPRMTPSATELHEAGVTFQKKRNLEPYERASQLDISFKDGLLEIPAFMVTHSTCSRLKNLIAFEQCYVKCPSNFTSYCIFLDDVINTADDVAILRRSQILKSRLGSDSEVAEMFNGLCKEVFMDYETHYNAELYRDVGRFYEMPHNRWRANLVQKYFSSPWAIISVLAGVILVGFTIAQTIFTIFPRK